MLMQLQVSGSSQVRESLYVEGARKQSSKEVSLRRRILFFCMLEDAISRENALLLLKPI